MPCSGHSQLIRGGISISPFSGPYVSGKVVINLATAALSGHLSRVKLGRVTLQSVAISGTAANPAYSVNQNRVLVDGRGPSAGRGPSIPAELPRALPGRAVRERGPERLLRGLLGDN